MIYPLIEPSEFLGLEGVTHLCAAGESPVLRSHLDSFARFAADKSAGMAGRARLEDTLTSVRSNLSWMVDRPASDIALLGHSSEGVNVVSQAMDWHPGDNVVLADVEYPSLIYPWTRLAGRGVEIRVVPTRDWVLRLDDLRATVDRRTRLVAVSQVSYLTGQRLNIAATADVAWQVGARLLVDATHALGVVPVDANLCDFLVSSCYKWLLGVHGVGIFVWNRSRVPELEPASLGWHSVSERGGVANPTQVALRPNADRFEIGNPSFPSVYVLNDALERLATLSAAAVEQHAIGLSGLIWEGLARRGWTMMTPEPPNQRAGNVCCAVSDAAPLAACLADEGVLVWGSEGRVRISSHVYNSSDDVERLFAAIDRGAGTP
ncbi:MAG TPA: aminotransferase class V-fold PLP-dependent enzyme [Chloroflexota bacterium]|nr:aminotransferase class V-fold PLP-dependent enzyme [Chloroflexota bacterium]